MLMSKDLQTKLGPIVYYDVKSHLDKVWFEDHVHCAPHLEDHSQKLPKPQTSTLKQLKLNNETRF